MDDEVLAARAALVRVALAGEQERALDGVAVYLLRGLAAVLLDDREEIAEQDSLVVRELGLGPGRRMLSCRSTGRWRKSRSWALAWPLPPPFPAGFFFGVVARGFAAAAPVARLVAPRPASFGAAFAARAVGLAAGFSTGLFARSRVLGFPPVRGSLGIGSSLERTPAASAVRRASRPAGRGRRL